MSNNNRTPESLLARRALAEKATPGPWEKDGSCVYTTWSREEYPERGYYVDVPGFAEIRVAETENCIAEEEIKANAAHIAANSPDVVMADIEEILRLRAEVERLEKEADWLALVLANAGCGVPPTEYINSGVNGMSPPAPEHWREAARKAVEEECPHEKL